MIDWNDINQVKIWMEENFPSVFNEEITAEEQRAEMNREIWLGMARQDYPEKSDQELLEMRNYAANAHLWGQKTEFSELYEKFDAFMQLKKK